MAEQEAEWGIAEIVDFVRIPGWPRESSPIVSARYKRVAGRISGVEKFGFNWVQIEIPDVRGVEQSTQLYRSSNVNRIIRCTEEEAKRAALILENFWGNLVVLFLKKIAKRPSAN